MLAVETMRLPIGEGLIGPSVQGGSRISSVHSILNILAGRNQDITYPLPLHILKVLSQPILYSASHCATTHTAHFT
jgi:hypothetical protein